SERARAVGALESRVDETRRERWPAGDVFPRAELAVGGYAVRGREPGAARIVGLDHRDELGLVRIALREGPVGEVPAVSRPDHDQLDGPHRPKASGCGSLDLRDRLPVLRKGQDGAPRPRRASGPARLWR